MSEIQIDDYAIVVDAEVTGKALGIDKNLVQPLLRQGKITTLSERGIDDDAGTHRLTFFYDRRRARLIVNEHGHILRRSSFDFGDRATPAMMRRSRR
jgi:Family of unknown function (DUF6522)